MLFTELPADDAAQFSLARRYKPRFAASGAYRGVAMLRAWLVPKKPLALPLMAGIADDSDADAAKKREM